MKPCRSSSSRSRALRDASISIQSSSFLLLCCCIYLLLPSHCEAACSNGKCQLRQTCVRNSDCSTGLFCSTCVADGDVLLRCHRYKATNVTAIRGGLPFNRYSWLTTHNAFAIVGEPSKTSEPRLTFENQEDSITSQLQNGVRGLMLDMYDFLGDIWLCHSFGGVCYNFTAFEPAINTLREIEAFLSGNPTEIITIFIEDYVRTPKGLTKLFTAAGLFKYWFPVSSMPKNGGDWPTLSDMIAKNHRLLVFTSNRTKESSEGIAYNWKYVNENQYGKGGMQAGQCLKRGESAALNDTSRSLVLMNFFPDDTVHYYGIDHGKGGMQAGQCPKRGESAALNDTSRSLVLMNFFPDDPIQVQACKYNSAPILNMIPVCFQASGNRWPNYLAVDFYKRSDGGGTFAAIDMLNAGLICGCTTTSSCKLNLAYGTCDGSNSNLDSNPPLVASSSKFLPGLFHFLCSFCLTWAFSSPVLNRNLS